jgi:dihydroorotate dehydrogenase electron transfer subunit
MNDQKTKIISNEKITEQIYRMTFFVGWKKYDPGQFLMLKIPRGEVFLRRPFGIAGLSNEIAEIFYKTVGKGTRAMVGMKAGSEVEVLGPLGRGFDLSQVVGVKQKIAVLVAGGYGLSPMIGLVASLVSKGCALRLYLGAKNSQDVFYVDHLRKSGAILRIATEDGSLGEKGLVTELLEKELSCLGELAIYACGPDGLLDKVKKMALEKNLFCEISKDAYLACGVGVCLGCVCKDLDGNFVRTCREGPVFDVRKLEA